jgi:hypothetical protein
MYKISRLYDNFLVPFDCYHEGICKISIDNMMTFMALPAYYQEGICKISLPYSHHKNILISFLGSK